MLSKHDATTMSYQELENELTYELQLNRDLSFELSELKNRTCENCKFFDDDTGKSYGNCELLNTTIGCETKKEFYCAYWESKEWERLSLDF